ncbi:helix-turn-helix domain-containing protein [Kribbella sp. NPDC050281]|uniref:TetR/AcrR family transcriptional regulator n=1 Tax=Kribbella sp. NPDC050281 TaxID=3155515 RepID=UPI0033C2D4D4
MPRVSDTHKAARRTLILDAARTCFARKGYQLTTIRELETESGLSSGAIFNYYPTKLDIFIALAEEDSAHGAQRWREGGLRAVVDDYAQTGLRYTASYLEIGRQLLTDPDFRRRWEQRGQVVVEAVRDRLQTLRDVGSVRTDVPLDHLVTYSLITLDGTLLQLRLSTPLEQVHGAVDLYEQTLRPPQEATR